MSTYMAIDPGSNGTGFVIWTPENKKILDHGNVFGHSTDWQMACRNIQTELSTKWGQYDVKKIYIEYPQFFATAGGEMVAGHGSLVKLAFIVGLICGAFRYEFELIEVLKWKGQLPKDVVISRIKKILPQEICKHFKTHTWDAIGIMLHVQGRFD